MSTIIEDLETTGDFVKLDSTDLYADYFARVRIMLERLLQWHKGKPGGNIEQAAIAYFLPKLLRSIELLRLKSLSVQEPLIRLDLNDSGYPHTQAIISLETDLSDRDNRIRNLEPASVTEQRIVDGLFTELKDQPELVCLRYLREYLDRLENRNMFLTFNEGKLSQTGTSVGLRHYAYYWACYDPLKSIPNIYIMTFDQDDEEEPLETKSYNWQEFMKVIRFEGARVPKLVVVAASIDQKLPTIHPKVIKRIKLGPLFMTPHTVGSHPILEVLHICGSDGDACMHIKTEMIASVRQTTIKRGIFKSDQIMEVFSVTQEDMECAESGATHVSRMLILPHEISQHLPTGLTSPYSELITYLPTGEIHAV